MKNDSKNDGLLSHTPMGSFLFLHSSNSDSAEYTRYYDYVIGLFPKAVHSEDKFYSRTSSSVFYGMTTKPCKTIYQKIKLSRVQFGPDFEQELPKHLNVVQFHDWTSYHVPVSIDIIKNYYKCQITAWQIGDPDYYNQFSQEPPRQGFHWISKEERFGKILRIVETMMETADIIGLSFVPCDIMLPLIHLGTSKTYFVQWTPHPSDYDVNHSFLRGQCGNCQNYCPIWKIPHHVLMTKKLVNMICKQCNEHYKKNEHYKGKNALCPNCKP